MAVRYTLTIVHFILLVILHSGSDRFLASAQQTCSVPDCFVCSGTTYACSVCPSDHRIPDNVTDLTILPLTGPCVFLSGGILAPTHFSRFTHLETLVLDGLNIQKFAGSVFLHNTNLKRLSLANNQLSGTGISTFQPLIKLEDLNLSNNSISSLLDNNFAGPTSLKTLNMAENELASLQTSKFQGLGNLETLILSSSPITTTDADFFKSLANVSNVLMNNMSLTAIPPGLFYGLAELKTIDLRDNEIKKIVNQMFSDFTAENVNLAGNPISQIEDRAFMETSINTLDLSNLQSSALHINNFAFSGLYVTNLRLAGNGQTTLVIEENAFNGCTIDNLDLSHAGLTRLPEFMKYWITSSQFNVNLSGNNNWRCDCGDMWLGEYLSTHKSKGKSPICGLSSSYPGSMLTTVMSEMDTSCFQHSRAPIESTIPATSANDVPACTATSIQINNTQQKDSSLTCSTTTNVTSASELNSDPLQAPVVSVTTTTTLTPTTTNNNAFKSAGTVSGAVVVVTTITTITMTSAPLTSTADTDN